MNPGSLEEARKIAGGVKRSMKKIRRTQVVLCPPFVYLSPLSNLTKGNLFLGAQNAEGQASGPYTGEVSYTQLEELNVRFVIIGHSERRKMGETDERINKKIKSIASGSMTAVVCIGEKERDTNGEYLDFVKQQIVKALKDVNKKSLDNIVIAYEPIWAVGAKDSMSPRDLHEMSIFCKKVLRDLYGSMSDAVRVIYGGAVDRVNADRLISEGNVSGFLVGRESLNPKDFMEIVRLADQI